MHAFLPTHRIMFIPSPRASILKSHPLASSSVWGFWIQVLPPWFDYGSLGVWWLKDVMCPCAPNSVWGREKVNPLAKVEEGRPATLSVAPCKTPLNDSTVSALSCSWLRGRVSGDVKPARSISFVSSACCLVPYCPCVFCLFVCFNSNIFIQLHPGGDSKLW